ncbi:hypothetical protein E2K98_28800 [Bacillus salipaludis]|uniref:Uncharacterized protein n=1 Tax=Bacillus salipaludis TaxID=2547811 RepID=A0A4R5VHX1_9BACI|nr:hypothetical protein [Bacillus salipaludis]TDK54745.1 hypothetical protein E2K98_28800 [Bacillus salipaludis]
MKKFFSALMLLMCGILMFQMPTNAEGLLHVTKVEDDPIVKELLQKLEKNETISNPRFKIKHTVLDEKENTVKELNLDTKYAVTTKKKILRDGTTRDEVYMLAATPLSDTNSRTYSGVTQYNLLEWYVSGNYVKLWNTEGWWTRTSSTYSVKNGYVFASQQGSKQSTGFPGSCSGDYTVGTPSWISNSTGKYGIIMQCEYLSYPDGTAGSFTRADIYSGSTKIYSQLKTSASP